MSSANLIEGRHVLKGASGKRTFPAKIRFPDSVIAYAKRISQLQELNQTMIDKVRFVRKTTEIIFNSDSKPNKKYGFQYVMQQCIIFLRVELFRICYTVIDLLYFIKKI